ncbi:MAG: S41 family peptidase [Bacteroidota bacterium]
MNRKSRSRGPVRYRDPVRLFPLMVLLVFVTCAFSLTSAQQTDMLSGEDQEELIKEIVAQIEKIYPFPEIAQRMVVGVTGHLRDGKYAKYTNPAEFAQRVSADLGELSSDSHMGLTYNPARAAEMKASEEEGLENPYAASTMETERWKNFGFKELRILEGNVGYLDLRTFFALKYAGETAVAAMGYFANCNALIIDLRRNGGGWDDMVTFLASYFFDTDAGIVFGVGMSTKDSSFYPSVTSAYVPGKLLADIPLYILVSGGTASAAEAFASIMKNMRKDATLVGETTAGAENPLETVIIQDEYSLWGPGWKKIFSSAKSGWEGVGVEPDVKVAADSALTVAHWKALNLLKERAADDAERGKYRWAMDGVKASDTPMIIEEELRQGYAGQYGNRTVYLVGDELYYQYKDRPKRRMLAVSKEYFVVEGYDWFRVKFFRENGELAGFEEVRTDGSVVRCRRE